MLFGHGCDLFHGFHRRLDVRRTFRVLAQGMWSTYHVLPKVLDDGQITRCVTQQQQQPLHPLFILLVGSQRRRVS